MYIRDLVFSALTNAKENEFFEPGMSLAGMSPFEIACDLVEHDADLGVFEPESLVQYVQEFLNS